jgi:hypothetical protein
VYPRGTPADRSAQLPGKITASPEQFVVHHRDTARQSCKLSAGSFQLSAFGVGRRLLTWRALGGTASTESSRSAKKPRISSTETRRKTKSKPEGTEATEGTAGTAWRKRRLPRNRCPEKCFAIVRTRNALHQPAPQRFLCNCPPSPRCVSSSLRVLWHPPCSRVLTLVFSVSPWLCGEQ